MMIIEVRPLGLKEFGLYVNDKLLGTSKLECDAMMAKYLLEREYVTDWKDEPFRKEEGKSA